MANYNMSKYRCDLGTGLSKFSYSQCWLSVSPTVKGNPGGHGKLVIFNQHFK